MLLVLSLGRDKWYQSNLITQCDVEALHDACSDEDVKDLSGGELWHTWKLVPEWEDELLILSGWIIKVLVDAKSHWFLTWWNWAL
jgi:hypothetical protein